MSLNKIILGFLIVLFLFGGILFYQFISGSNLKDKVTIGEKTFRVQVVEKPEALQKGLSGKSSLPDDQGMLFLFADKGDHPFWMKDMKFAIDIIFINDNKIVSIIENAPAPKTANENLPLYRSDEPANKVLEVKAGSVKKYNIKDGDQITFVAGK